MQFLKTLFWVALSIVLVLFAHANWRAVQIDLWGGLAADVKLPILVLLSFLLGFAPTFLFYRARLWKMRRRIEAIERNNAPTSAPASSSDRAEDVETERRIALGADERLDLSTGGSPAR